VLGEESIEGVKFQIGAEKESLKFMACGPARQTELKWQAGWRSIRACSAKRVSARRRALRFRMFSFEPKAHQPLAEVTFSAVRIPPMRNIQERDSSKEKVTTTPAYRHSET